MVTISRWLRRKMHKLNDWSDWIAFLFIYSPILVQLYFADD